MAPKSLIATIAFATALACAPASAGKLYKWVDEDGNVTYSQQKPPGTEASEIELKGYHAPDAAAARDSATQAREKADAAREDREFAAGEAEAQRERSERLRKNCEIARQNLRILQNSARVQDKDQEGNPYFLDASQIEARTAKAKKQVEDFCN